MSVLKLSMEERQSRVTITSEPFLSTSFTHLSFHLKKKYTFNLHNSSFIIKMRIWICFDIWMLVYCYSVEFSPIRKHQRVLTNSSRKKKKIEIIPPWPYNSIHSYLTHESCNTYYLCQLQLIRKDGCTSWSFNTRLVPNTRLGTEHKIWIPGTQFSPIPSGIEIVQTTT